jgi:hypothetical protein
MQRMKLIAATLALTLFGSAVYADPIIASPDPYPLVMQRDRAETSEAMAHTEAFMWQNRAMQAERELAQLRAKQAAASGCLMAHRNGFASFVSITKSCHAV